jgi:DNA repair protein RadC
MLPREKFTKFGIDSLKDCELVAIIVGSGIKGRNFKLISQAIVSKFKIILENGNPVGVSDLSKIDGVGNVTAMKLLAGIELGRRLYGVVEDGRQVVTNSKQAYELLKDYGFKKKEYVVALFLNSRFEVLKKKIISIGSLDNVGILPRDVIIPALECNCAYVVLAHNHPSGDVTPSQEDILVTKRISEAFGIVGLELIDHIVLSRDNWRNIDL